MLPESSRIVLIVFCGNLNTAVLKSVSNNLASPPLTPPTLPTSATLDSVDTTTGVAEALTGIENLSASTNALPPVILISYKNN